MLCKLCGSEAHLVDSHIIPRPFFVGTCSTSNDGKILSNVPGVFPKRSPIGPYDDGILCAACDASMGPWDEIGVRYFLQELEEFVPVEAGGKALAFTRSEYDYASSSCSSCLFFGALPSRAIRCSVG
jgi:hypothetical protein